jgi:serine/threonine protein kinase
MAKGHVDHAVLPLSPPYWCSQSLRYAQRIEFCNEEFVLSSAKRQPDIFQFPAASGHDVINQKIEHSKEKNIIWRQSRLFAYGSYGSVREYTPATDAFPLVKLAHQTPLARQLISDEFSMIKEMSSQGLPIVKVDDQPLKDQEGVFGFSMEKLITIDLTQDRSFGNDVEDLMKQLHCAGYVHGDFSPSNVMRTTNGELRLIDLSHAGKIGQPLPHYHPARKINQWHIFEREMDLLELEKMRRMKVL